MRLASKLLLWRGNSPLEECSICQETTMTPDPDDLYHELSYYTLAHPGPSFIHQHIVDAYTAQHANETTKPIAVIFALIGLYLHVEKNFTGRQVQRFHMKLAKIRRQWVRPQLPKERGASTCDMFWRLPEVHQETH